MPVVKKEVVCRSVPWRRVNLNSVKNGRKKVMDTIRIGDHRFPVEDVLQIMPDFSTPSRLEKLHQVVRNKSNTVIPVCEKIYDSGNLNAVIRTTENFGFCQINVVESQQLSYESEPPRAPTVKIEALSTTADCLTSLKEKGYSIISLCLQTDSIPLNEFKFPEKAPLSWQ